MAELIGTVSEVKILNGSGKEPMRIVSIEGFSLLVPREIPDGQLPKQGAFVRARCSVFWRKGKPPLHFFGGFTLENS